MRRLIVVGGSAGAIQALCKLLEGLDNSLAASILSVIHIGEGTSHLDAILRRHTSFQVVRPTTPQNIAAGFVYVPAPDTHLLVRSGCVLSVKGPRENRHRPSVDTLFRSAARFFQKDLIAVILSGALDDGSAGALAVKSRGGTVIVQDPDDARIPDMPANALRAVEPDYCVPVGEMAALLNRLVRDSPLMQTELPSASVCQDVSMDSSASEQEPNGFTCPECGGAVLRIQEGDSIQFRCHVGHRYSLESFSEAHANALERALWIALRRLNEQRAIHEALAEQNAGRPALKKRFAENAAASANDIRLLHDILARL